MPVRGKDGSYYDDVDELIRANTQWEQREKQNKLLKEQNILAQQQLQMQQQVMQQQQEALQQQQEALQQQQELERQKKIAENNAEIERLTNMLREHCRSVGIDYDYMISFYENCYKEKEKTEEILNLDEEINECNDHIELIKLKNIISPLRKKQWIFAFLLTPITFAVFGGLLYLLALKKYVLSILGLILSICILIKPWKKYLKLSNEINSRNKEIYDIIIKYRTFKYKTLQENEAQLKALIEKKNLSLTELNANSKKYQKEFDEFRRNHYNKEIELLFKDLEINFNKIDKNDIKANGTAEDYKEYFEDKILEN